MDVFKSISYLPSTIKNKEEELKDI